MHQWDFPLWGLFRASYFQSFNSIFLVALAPVFAWLWVRLGRSEPSSTAKFSWGLVFVGLGFAILIPVANGTNVEPLVAHADLSAAHDRRTLPEPGRPERDDEARARAYRRTHDGRLVPLDFGGRLSSADGWLRSMRRSRCRCFSELSRDSVSCSVCCWSS